MVSFEDDEGRVHTVLDSACCYMLVDLSFSSLSVLSWALVHSTYRDGQSWLDFDVVVQGLLRGDVAREMVTVTGLVLCV